MERNIDLNHNFDRFDLISYLNDTYSNNEFEIKPFVATGSVIPKNNVLYYIKITSLEFTTVNFDNLKGANLLILGDTFIITDLLLCSSVDNNANAYSQGYQIIFQKKIY